MPYMSRITIVGHTGKNAEFEQTNSGLSLLKFSVAVNKRKKDDGTMWFNVAVFGKDADYWDGKINKGDTVMVDGNFELREWVDGEAKRGSLYVVASKILNFAKRDVAATPQNQAAPKKEFGKYDTSKLDEEVNLDDDDPYKEDF
jgi:single-strand DNA-binding protein